MQFSLQCATLLAPVWTATNFTKTIVHQPCYGTEKKEKSKSQSLLGQLHTNICRSLSLTQTGLWLAWAEHVSPVGR
jgi:hypothetical protein